MGQIDHTTGAHDAGPSDSDRLLLRDSIRGFLARRWPASQAVARSGDPQAIATLWHELSAQGLTSLGSDPAEGGLRELVLVFEELGRASCPAPLLGAMTANLALAPMRESSKATGTPFEPAATLLDKLRHGTVLIAASYGTHDGDSAAGEVKVNGGNATCTLDGRLAFVEDAACATHFIVFTRAPAGIAIVTADAAGLSIRETPGLAVPALSELMFHGTPGTRFDVEAGTLSDLVLLARLACAARAVGAAQRSFELAVEHAKVRRQFGQVIGQFQAMQHKLADCLISLEGARLTLDCAAKARDMNDPDWRVMGSAALAFAGPAIREVSVQAICALGAIGYAEEHEAPRHFRRVHADLARFGGAPRARAELADSVLGPVT
jgi:3-oxo-4-pregnene-20-carboxyl-CoA dehydrogenase beta subunit